MFNFCCAFYYFSGGFCSVALRKNRLSALPLSLHPPRRYAPAVDRFAGAPILAAKTLDI